MSSLHSVGSRSQSVGSRSQTLHIVDLLATKVQSVRIELLGNRSSTVTRLGTVLVYMPLLIIGYLLMVTSLMKGAAVVLGWGVTLFLFGAVHVTMGLWGMTRDRNVGAAISHDVMDPSVIPDDAKQGAPVSRLPRPSPAAGPTRDVGGRRP
jgi:hypothetical protein